MEGSRIGRRAALAAAAAWAWASPGQAWVFHEHATVTVDGVERLSAPDRATLDTVWSVVRGAAPEVPLALDVAARASVVPDGCDAGPRCSRRQIGFGPLPALAGDHACTTAELARVLEQGWVDEVLAEAERMEAAVAGDIPAAARVDRWHLHHLEMRSVDTGYRSRAAETSSHFQLPRRLGESLPEYVRRVADDESNATTMYVAFHLAALSRASRIHALCPSGRRGCLAAQATALWQVLLAEAFALHFLEDAFSAGHVVGTYGADHEQMGTHDYYCQHGIEATPWRGGGSYHAHGDAHLTHVDRLHAAGAVSASLGQVIATLRGGLVAPLPPHGAHDRIDACRAGPSPRGLARAADWAPLGEVAGRMIQPRPAQPLLPRFPSQVGVFASVAISAGLGGEPFDAGRDAAVSPDERWGGMMQARLGAGFAAEGITSSAMDSFLSLEGILEAEGGYGSGQSIGLGGSLHVPWAYVPLDGLVYLIADGAFDVLHKPAMTALAGGIGGWQRPRTVYRGLRIQVSLLRRFSLVWYPGYRGRANDSQDRWRFVFPVITALFGQQFSERHSSQFFADLSFEYSHVPGLEHAFGFRVDIGLHTRRFLQ